MRKTLGLKNKQANAGKPESEKTNQDFNSKMPNPTDPNEVKGHPKLPYPKIITKKVRTKL